MDATAHTKSLEAETSELKHFLSAVEPAYLARIKQQLFDNRSALGELHERIGRLYAAHRDNNPGKPPADEIQKLERERGTIEGEVASLRAQLAAARAKWRP